MWIQAIKLAGEWRFYDGEPFPTDVCTIKISNSPDEIHLGMDSHFILECIDAPSNESYHYVCEYYRQFKL